MDLVKFKQKLENYSFSQIYFTEHSRIQGIVREIHLNEVKKNLLSPFRLVYVKQQSSRNIHEKKYNCYFAYSKYLFHRYAIVLNRKIIIVTIIKINRNWQKAIG
jgi:hypothetical protein